MSSRPRQPRGPVRGPGGQRWEPAVLERSTTLTASMMEAARGSTFFFGGRTLLRHLRVRSQAQGPATRYRGWLQSGPVDESGEQWSRPGVRNRARGRCAHAGGAPNRANSPLG